ncbi:uncharacterized protein BO87DRAFT_391160 [Aspergillus neoniger CBS 115656]|uniref:Uncharacterized protein n=1 Tax=Aspergillus neoniger (strain CBS 115656) TaxID=1448310 RepID=A0A318YAG2_ASPNB|nr:hypothetical protein BO87DRAFT_391160 [Aspergillus neoniger CBS 115656]PYH29303.1 hypothetical protein BO87DRAFT_391160 [Aspergillus neoniger CBS 115656]
MVICGGDHGGLDGSRCYGHQQEQMSHNKTNSHSLLIENIYCDSNGRCAIGSLDSRANVCNYRLPQRLHRDTNQTMIFKSNGSSSYVSNVVFGEFIIGTQTSPIPFLQFSSTQNTRQ